MKLLVCGGRRYDDAAELYRRLDHLKPDLVITGGATGADRLAQNWACDRGIPCMVFPPAWECLGTRAGSVRNGWMLLHGRPDMVLAFPGGPGTADMVSRAVRAKVMVQEVRG